MAAPILESLPGLRGLSIEQRISLVNAIGDAIEMMLATDSRRVDLLTAGGDVRLSLYWVRDLLRVDILPKAERGGRV